MSQVVRASLKKGQDVPKKVGEFQLWKRLGQKECLVIGTVKGMDSVIYVCATQRGFEPKTFKTGIFPSK